MRDRRRTCQRTIGAGMKSSYERLAYARGYNAGVRGRWPEHRPPAPPHPLVRNVLAAAQGLRDEIDSLFATLCEDDEFNVRIDPHIAAFDESMVAIDRWLREGSVLSTARLYKHVSERSENK